MSKYNSQVVTQITSLLPSIAANFEIKFELKGYLKRLQKPFDFINTDHKFFKHLEQINVFRYPAVINIEKDQNSSVSFTSVDVVEKKYTTVMNDVEFQLRSYFSDEKILQETIQCTNKLQLSAEYNLSSHKKSIASVVFIIAF